MASTQSRSMMVGKDPEILPIMLDLTQDQVLLARLSLREQGLASFLDERAVGPATATEWLSWTDFRNLCHAAPDAAPAYILHVSHCGSTLLSRLVEAASGARSLREPLPLRTFAVEAVQSLDGGAFLMRQERVERIRLFEKAWCCGAAAVIKSTSICNDIADDLCARAPVSFIYVRPETYLATVLGRPRVKGDLRAYGQLRLRRWNARAGWLQRMSDLSPGELAALCWLTETTSIVSAQRNIAALEFDNFLANPHDKLSALCSHLGVAAAPDRIEQTLAGPMTKVYSKNLERAYDAAARAQVLNHGRAKAGDEISAGLAWLDTAAKAWKTAELALNRYG
ncbi:hypothetical protein [Hyphococcus sp.]|uniref:hypothetical protein n=1 Tax=Hyphococcus sp. TaxID=2038636 RepID=UPI003D0EB7F5